MEKAYYYVRSETSLIRTVKGLENLVLNGGVSLSKRFILTEKKWLQRQNQLSLLQSCPANRGRVSKEVFHCKIVFKPILYKEL